MVGRYLGDPGEGVAAAGVRGAAAVVDALAPVLDAAGWAAVVEALLDAVADDPLAALAPETSGTATCPHHENSFTAPIICESNMLFLASACCGEFGTGVKPLSELASPLPGSFQIFYYQETDRNDQRARTRTHTNDVQIPLVWLLYAGAMHKRYLPLQQEPQEQRLRAVHLPRCRALRLQRQAALLAAVTSSLQADMAFILVLPDSFLYVNVSPTSMKQRDTKE